MKVKNYNGLNFVSFLFSTFITISFLVFQAATQSFFLTDILGIGEKIGNYIGTLGFLAELVTLATSPFFGALSDKIGTRIIAASGVLIIGVSLMLYTFATNVYPTLLIFRLFFALGSTASSSMITTMLTELSASDYKIPNWFKRDSGVQLEGVSEETNSVKPRRNGKLASLVGVCAGLGGIFSVSVFLPLPVFFGKTHPAAIALEYSYYVVGSVAILSATFLYFGLYNNPLKPLFNRTVFDDLAIIAAVDEEADDDDIDSQLDEQHKLHNTPYVELIKKGFQEGKEDPNIMLAYVGSFVARSSTVAESLFVPLFVYHYYYTSGKCQVTDKLNCYDGYKHAAILKGIAQTVAFISAPFWGYISEKYGRKSTLIATSTVGFFACMAMAFLQNPLTLKAVFIVSIFGICEIGTMICSMSLVTDTQRLHSGAITGFYAFFGGCGILIITKLGGVLADIWIGGPFFIMGVFYVVLFVSSLYASGRLERVWGFRRVVVEIGE